MSPNVRSSATATALQIPLMPRSSGRRSTAASWNTSVRRKEIAADISPVSYTHLRAHETDSYLVCRLLLEKKKKRNLGRLAAVCHNSK